MRIRVRVGFFYPQSFPTASKRRGPKPISLDYEISGPQSPSGRRLACAVLALYPPGMIGLLQRVSLAAVVVDSAEIARIGQGLLVLIGVQKGDGALQADRLLERLLTYRVFADDAGRMNRSVQDVGGGLLLVPQFTLAADTRKGTRPGFSPAAEPAEGKR